MMTWELFEKILEELKAFQGQVKVINLYGYGEPLLHPRIADMVRLLKENHCCREVRITTNASLLSEEKSHALVEAGVAVGYGDGTYRPRSYITRAESAKMIVQITVNALNELERTNIQKYAYCPFTDIKRGQWAYAYILRAAGVA